DIGTKFMYLLVFFNDEHFFIAENNSGRLRFDIH
ncbi:unnamed protein product, partial [Rotaria magnacalcarata]